MISTSIKLVMGYIIESEMAGKLDKKDPWYPAYLSLQDLNDKVEEEEEILAQNHILTLTR